KQSAASERDSPSSGCASQMRISTVGNARCGRTLHQICVCSVTEPVAYRKRTYASHSVQSAKTSGMPQRGNMRVKISVRAECRCVKTPSTNGELDDNESSAG